ncbi:MAG: hypothetical protein QW314_01350 [Thermoproteota archaeon]
MTDSGSHAEKLREILGEGVMVTVENVGKVEEESEDLDATLVNLTKAGWPGVTAAAEQAHVSRRTIQRHMAGLVALGVIKQDEEGKYSI